MARPLGVTILGVLVILVAIFVGLLALLLIAAGLAGAALGAGVLGSFVFISGLVFLIIAIILGLSGSGLLKLRPWAWWLAAIVIFLDLAWTGYGIFRGGVDTGSIFTALILLVLFVYMLSVRKYFRPGAYPA